MEFQNPKQEKADAQEAIRVKMSAWPECYYRESDGLIRRSYLEEADRENLTPEENKIRHLLWERRYPGLMEGSKSNVKDAFLRSWFDFRYAADSVGSIFLSKKTEKQIEESLKSIGFSAVKEYGEMGEKLLYDELYHMAMLYISLCREDKNYGSLVFGMGKVSEDRLISRIATELARVAVYVPEMLNMTEECRLWTKAIEAAFRDAYPDQSGYLEAAVSALPNRKGKKKS